jgi:hypothetical protein
MCAWCNVKPVWVGTGIEHDYCGRTHAEQAAQEQGHALAAPHGICHTVSNP